MAETKLEKLLGMTDRFFQEQHEDDLVSLAASMETCEWADELASEILNHKDFPDRCDDLGAMVSSAQVVGFDKDELKDMLKHDFSVDQMNHMLAEKIGDNYVEELNGEFNPDTFRDMNNGMLDKARSFFSESVDRNNQAVTGKGGELSLEEQLNQEIPKNFSRKQQKAITAVCAKVEEESVKYAEECGSEYAEKFDTAAMNKLADVVAFTSDNTPDQIRSLGDCVCSFLKDRKPENLENSAEDKQLNAVCDAIKKHEFPSAMYDFMIQFKDTMNERNDLSPIERIFIGGTDMYTSDFWENTKQMFAIFTMNDCLDDWKKGSYQHGVKEACCTLGLAPKDMNYVCQKANGFLNREKGTVKMGNFREMINFLMEKIEPKNVFEYIDILNENEYPADLAMRLVTDFHSEGFSIDLIKDCLREGLTGIHGSELRMAHADGFSDDEIRRCLDKSPIRMCQNRCRIKWTKEHCVYQDKPLNGVRSNVDRIKKEMEARKTENPAYGSEERGESSSQLSR